MLSAEANFNVGLVVRESIILAKFWRQSEEKKTDLLTNLTITLNGIFGTEATLEVITDPDHYAATGGGSLANDTAITMSKNSLMTYLYMYGVVLLRKGFVFAEHEDNSGNDVNNPLSWAHTIFCLASRSEYFSSKARGLFFSSDVPFVTPITNCKTREDVDIFYKVNAAELTPQLAAIAEERDFG